MNSNEGTNTGFGKALYEKNAAEKVSELTLEEKFEKVKDLRPIDDVFFEVLADDIEVCQEILCTILEDPNLVVKKVTVQSSKRNLYGRSVRLDALCVLGDGSLVNIEVQRSDDDDHFKRIRLNGSVITAKESQKGFKFKEVPELYIVYISEFDIIDEGKTTYHIDKVVRETGTVVEDGLHIICVNTVNDDGSDTADLMSCFTKKEVNNPKFPKFSGRVKLLKKTEGGVESMCKVMRHYEEIAETRGEDRLSKLVNGLLTAGNTQEAIRVTSDPEYRRQMLAATSERHTN